MLYFVFSTNSLFDNPKICKNLIPFKNLHLNVIEFKWGIGKISSYLQISIPLKSMQIFKTIEYMNSKGRNVEKFLRRPLFRRYYKKLLHICCFSSFHDSFFTFTSISKNTHTHTYKATTTRDYKGNRKRCSKSFIFNYSLSAPPSPFLSLHLILAHSAVFPHYLHIQIQEIISSSKVKFCSITSSVLKLTKSADFVLAKLGTETSRVRRPPSNSRMADSATLWLAANKMCGNASSMMNGSRSMNGNPSTVSGTVGAKCCHKRILSNISVLEAFVLKRFRSDTLLPKRTNLRKTFWKSNPKTDTTWLATKLQYKLSLDTWGRNRHGSINENERTCIEKHQQHAMSWVWFDRENLDISNPNCFPFFNNGHLGKYDGLEVEKKGKRMKKSLKNNENVVKITMRTNPKCP